MTRSDFFCSKVTFRRLFLGRLRGGPVPEVIPGAWSPGRVRGSPREERNLALGRPREERNLALGRRREERNLALGRPLEERNLAIGRPLEERNLALRRPLEERKPSPREAPGGAKPRLLGGPWGSLAGVALGAPGRRFDAPEGFRGVVLGRRGASSKMTVLSTPTL